MAAITPGPVLNRGHHQARAVLKNHLPPGPQVWTADGRTALLGALLRVGVEGKRVVLPAYICSAVSDTVRAAGGQPVFVPVSADLMLDLVTLEKVVPGASAVIVVHYYGFA